MGGEPMVILCNPPAAGNPIQSDDTEQDYKRLSELPADEYGKWTQERIAKAKGVGRSRVTERIQFAQLPESVLKIVQLRSLQEAQIREILELSNLDNFSPWLDREAAMLAVIDSVLKRKKIPTAVTLRTGPRRWPVGRKTRLPIVRG